MQGTENFSKIFPESNTLFVLPPSLNDLEQRLIDRGTETKTQLETRLKNEGCRPVKKGFMVPSHPSPQPDKERPQKNANRA